MEVIMRKIFLFFMITVFCSVLTNSQDGNYWLNAQPGSAKIFTIAFVDELNGEAISAEGDILITKDGGENWNLSKSQVNNKFIEKYIWEADIYCAVMKTTDSGLNWFPFDKERQEHFCCVYLKDKNTGYKIASNFLNTVVSKIFTFYKNKEPGLLINHPQQCTEYYSNINEGWALGWCVKEFK